ncbi:MAG TPA: NADH:flavin oxidoreductase [Deferrisomatales bacterium]|nr:NADH:flavin oxidoreductase [Deferrisomatales bacterium]
MNYEELFSPIKLRNLTLPNRIMRTSMVSGLATEDGHVTPELKARYQREARGGVGSIVVEAAVVLPSRSSYNLRISDDSFTEELRALVEAVREANPQTRMGIQIMHFLKIAKSGWRQKVTDFKPEDLPVIVEQHVAAARRAVAAGFDFIELHMAHAYTLSSFLSLTNGRTDEYGGSLKNRMRLPIQVYQAVRGAVGEDYPLGVRINGEDFTIKGTTLLQSRPIARKLAELGADFISVSAGSRFEDAPPPPPDTPPDPMSGYSGHRMSPDWWFPDLTHVYLADPIREEIRNAGYDVPIVTAGKIRTPQQAEGILEAGKADLVGLCRALLCDPDWPVKAAGGRAKEIVTCTACNWCLESDSRMEKVNCSRWPEGELNAPSPWQRNAARPSAIVKEAEGAQDE